MIFLSSVAATLVFFDHSGDIIHINISTSVGVEVAYIAYIVKCTLGEDTSIKELSCAPTSMLIDSHQK